MLKYFFIRRGIKCWVTFLNGVSNACQTKSFKKEFDTFV